ncbi:tetratricopeptide repeat protein [Noviherbaspirillum sp.]|jgi:predicted O-linked N-acetylglucosamine transferase (SPINDLY family)|uniref:O-linked N-acetylglucosamine transferase family protein n=1 Tax=Noviherbaspirillum sp. TaxID=1926288 RepID=UPI0025F97352|nr:tetratricopeptide repeat protein [Noviherbaspirillum sp.]
MMKGPISVFPCFGGGLWFYMGRWLERKGLTTLAESCYRSGASGTGRTAAEAGFQLSQRLMARDLNQEAVDACQEALRADPAYAKAWCALGAAQRHLARMDASREAYEKAIELDPDYAQAWSNLGEWWLVKGEVRTALEKIERALKIEPRLLQALNNRVAALYELAKFKDAEAAAREAIALHPNEAALHVNLGNVLLHSGKARPAVKAFRKALECDPSCPEAHLALSTLLGETRRLAETLEYFEHEIAVKGESVQRLASLALAQQAKGDLSVAEATCLKVLRTQPNNISALITLAGCLSVKGDHQGAIRLHERALVENPNMPAIYSNIAFDATYLPDISADDVFAYHREWADRFEKTNEKKSFNYVQSREADRPLRIGYVSGDFGRHPVGFLLRDVMRNHDRQQVEIYCYSMMRASDDVTDAIRSNAAAWIDALLMTDDELAEQIHQDQIDILVDLSGHTAYNRLPAFVRRPAPVQATWIGYFHSTGLKNIDYFITDPVTTPTNVGQLFSETPVCLPHSRFCYSPPEYAPSVAPSPVLDVGYITFGSFNRVEKLVDPVISAWIRILDAVPGSRLLLKAGVLENESVRDSLRRRFVEMGLKGDRLELRGPSQHPEMLEQYGEVDIALDPFPFNGGMTTLEALWMGVPVVTLAGNSVVSRQSASALTNIGLTELIFDDLAMYVEGAISLAHNVEHLSGLRQQIRRRMANSPLCQPEQFTHDLETLYRRMWHAWLRGEKLGAEIVPGTPVARKKVLHVGCGPADKRSLPAHFQSRWQEIRLDIDPGVNPDVVASMLDMAAVQSGSVDAVYSSHNIEHLYPHEVEVALKEFRRVLKPDGLLVLTCPDLQSVCALVADDKLEEPAYIAPAGPIAPIDILYGYRPAMARGNLFMAHKTGFTARSLERALRESGFETAVVERGPSHDLWALAYSGPVEAERIEGDRKTCFPASLNQ